MNSRGLGLALGLCCLGLPALAAEAQSPPVSTTPGSVGTPARIAPVSAATPVCTAIAEAAKAHGLPLDYFTRLIWRESRFRPRALSPAGAQGVAQFMPATAAERGLADPFATGEALMHSAAFLDELRATFGNLGLAAAAYNAGPGRVTRWLAGEAQLPQETLDYVVAVTGHAADAWRSTPLPAMRDDAAFDCARWALLASRSPEPSPAPSGTSRPWAIILLGSLQRDKAMSEYRLVRGQFSGILGGIEPTVVRKRISGMQVPRYVVQIERDSRAAADALCSRLMRAGGSCFVLANRG